MTTFNSQGKSIPVELYPTSWSGKRPVVVVVYGTRGMNDPFGKEIQDLAGTLADAGYAVLIPEYFKQTNTTAASSLDFQDDLAVVGQFISYGNVWLRTLGDCLAYAAGRSDVEADSLGLLG